MELESPDTGAGSREPGAGSREPGAGSQEPGAGNQEPGAGRQEPGAGNRVAGAGSRGFPRTYQGFTDKHSWIFYSKDLNDSEQFLRKSRLGCLLYQDLLRDEIQCKTDTITEDFEKNTMESALLQRTSDKTPPAGVEELGDRLWGID
jgi:hypothetical protein